MNAAEKIKAREIYNLSRNFITTLQILVSDVRYAEDSLQKDQGYEQFWRRAIIRAVCALGEAALNSLKGMIPKTADFMGISLTEEEMEILTEKRKKSDGTTKPLFLPIQENLKKTFRLFGKIHGFQVTIPFDQGYNDFCGTFALRNRLMHPKTHTELQIKDDAYRASIRGWNWFNQVTVNIIRECNRRLPFGETGPK